MEPGMKKYVVIALVVLVPLLAAQVFLNKKYKGGSSSETSAEQSGQRAAVSKASQEPPPPPKPAYRYRVPSANPDFGQPLDYARAMRGDALAVPGVKDASGGILVDLDSRRVLWEKKPETGVPIASMVKMMTLLIAFEVLEERKDLSLETPVQGTKAAMKVGGAQIWVNERAVLPLGDLLRSVAIKSANDAAYLVAEFLSDGNVPGFVARMNRRAKEIGMRNTVFYNPHGLTDTITGKDSVASPEDMVLLGERLLEYPQLMKWFSTPMDSVMVDGKEIELANHNKLVRPQYPGVDGLKTGYIARSGFCFTVSCLRNGQRVVGCVTGFKVMAERDAFSRKLVDWGYTQLAAGREF